MEDTRTTNRCPFVNSVNHLVPEVIINLSYTLYVYNSMSQNENGSVLPVKKAAEKICNDFEALVDSIDKNSPTGQFLFAIRTAIISLSRGIESKRAGKERTIRAAEQEKNRAIESIGKGQLWSGVIKAGMKLLMVSSALFLFSLAVMLSLPSFENTSRGEMSIKAAVPAFFISIIMYYLQSLYSEWRIHRIVDRYERIVKMAGLEYSRFVQCEYERAHAACSHAWKELFGYNPPELPGFKDLLIKMQELEDSYERGMTIRDSLHRVKLFPFQRKNEISEHA